MIELTVEQEQALDAWETTYQPVAVHEGDAWSCWLIQPGEAVSERVRNGDPAFMATIVEDENGALWLKPGRIDEGDTFAWVLTRVAVPANAPALLWVPGDAA